jgi:hypothetical protein
VQPSTDLAQWRFNQPTGPGWTGRPVLRPASAIVVSGAQVTLDINPTLSNNAAVPYDTAATNLQITTLTPSPTGIRDAAGNQASVTSPPVAVADGMNPVLRDVSMTFIRGLTPGLLEPGDSLAAMFTEPLTASSVADVTVTLSRAVGAPNATIDIPGLTQGAVNVRSPYFSSAGNTAQWPAHVVRSGNTITVTLTGPCSGAGCVNHVPGAIATMSMNVADDLFDAAGLVAVDPTSLTIEWF